MNIIKKSSIITGYINNIMSIIKKSSVGKWIIAKWDILQQKPLLLKSLAYSLSILFVICAATYGALSLASIFSWGFNSNVFIFPLLMIQKLMVSTVFILFIIIFLIYYAIKNPKFWYLIPASIIVIGAYWLLANILVYKAYIQRFTE